MEEVFETLICFATYDTGTSPLVTIFAFWKRTKTKLCATSYDHFTNCL